MSLEFLECQVLTLSTQSHLHCVPRGVEVMTRWINKNWPNPSLPAPMWYSLVRAHSLRHTFSQGSVWLVQEALGSQQILMSWGRLNSQLGFANYQWQVALGTLVQIPTPLTPQRKAQDLHWCPPTP